MKKYFLLGLLGLLGLAGNVRAQLSQGTRFAGATIGFAGNTSKAENAPNLTAKGYAHSVTPSLQFGRFFADNKMAGIGIGAFLNFAGQKQTYNNDDLEYKYTNMGFSLSPFIRNYKSLSPKWAIFLQSSLNLSYIRRANTLQDVKETDNGYAVGLQVVPGIAYWVTPRFALEADVNVLSLGVNYEHLKSADSFTFSSAVTTSLNSYFSIRASWYLQKQAQ